MSFLSFYLILKDLNNIALLIFLLGRIFDGVDGIIANKTRITEFGGFIDIVFDLISYSLVPLAFILKDNSNAIFGSILLATFFGTSSAFFGIAIFENNKFIKRNPEKSFYHVGGFMGGAITIFFLSLMFIFPEKFNLIALIFSVLCILGTIERIFYAYIILDSD
jgi:phosphatidylglycerophosphate synthase